MKDVKMEWEWEWEWEKEAGRKEGHTETVWVAGVVDEDITGGIEGAWTWWRCGDGTGQLLFWWGSLGGLGLLASNQYHFSCFSLLAFCRLKRSGAYPHEIR
jgi:hypothetical protein